MNKQAFTLVELIVSITILSILGTIAFLSLQWYSQDARNSTRLADLWSIESSLELYQTKTSKYPKPSNSFEVTYSWAVAWYQWNFWESALTNLWNLSKTPVDPLTGNLYTYSVTNSFWEYELATIEEGSTAMILNWVHAATNTANAIVIWTYNGKFLKVSKWSTDFILAVPSIITSEWSDISLLEILTNEALVFDGYSNAPSSYSTTYTSTWNFSHNLSEDELVIFSGSIDDLSDDNEKWELANKLEIAYEKSDLANSTEYTDVVALYSSGTKVAAITNYIANNEWWLYIEWIDKEDIKKIRGNCLLEFETLDIIWVTPWVLWEWNRSVIFGDEDLLYANLISGKNISPKDSNTYRMEIQVVNGSLNAWSLPAWWIIDSVTWENASFIYDSVNIELDFKAFDGSYTSIIDGWTGSIDWFWIDYTPSTGEFRYYLSYFWWPLEYTSPIYYTQPSNTNNPLRFFTWLDNTSQSGTYYTFMVKSDTSEFLINSYPDNGALDVCGNLIE